MSTRQLPGHWHRWFAWRPVSRRFLWLCTVERCRMRLRRCDGAVDEWFIYRDVVEAPP